MTLSCYFPRVKHIQNINSSRLLIKFHETKVPVAKSLKDWILSFNLSDVIFFI